MQAFNNFGASRLAAKVLLYVKDIGYAHAWSKIISLWLCASRRIDDFVAQANIYLMSLRVCGYGSIVEEMDRGLEANLGIHASFLSVGAGGPTSSCRPTASGKRQNGEDVPGSESGC